MDANRIETLLKTRAKLRQLQILAMIGQTGNIMKAAEALNMTQPVISRCVAQFESMLGMKLFERLPRGVAPTPAGLALLDSASAILAELRRVSSDLSETTSGDMGRLVIGFLPIGSAGPLPEAISRLTVERPKLDVRLIEGLYKDLAPMLRAGDIDLIFGRLHPTAHLAGLDHEVTYHHPWVLYGRKGHPLAKGGTRQLSDLKGLQWILPVSDSPARALVSRFFRRNGMMEPAHAIECSSLTMARAILLRTDRVIFLPKGAWGAEPAGLTELCVNFGESSEPVGILTVAGRRPREVEKKFRTLLIDAAQEWKSTTPS